MYQIAFWCADLRALEVQCKCSVDHVLRKFSKQKRKLVCWRIQMI